MTVFSSSSCSFRLPSLSCLAYEVGLGFIWDMSAPAHYSTFTHLRTLRLPPVMVTFTKRRVYVSLFFARPLGVFFFSWGSTWYVSDATLVVPVIHLQSSFLSPLLRYRCSTYGVRSQKRIDMSWLTLGARQG